MKSIRLALAVLALAASPLCSTRFAAAEDTSHAPQTEPAPVSAAPEPAQKPYIFLVPDGRPPYQLMNPDRHYNGFDIDVAYNLARTLGRRAEVYVVDEKQMLERLASGQADAAFGVEPDKK